MALLAGACGGSAGPGGSVPGATADGRDGGDAGEVTAPTSRPAEPDTASDTTAPTTMATPTTAAPTTTTTIPRTPASGALRLPSGLIVPVRAQLVDGRWAVGTPCGAEALVPAAGTWVEGVRVVLDPGHGGPETGTIGPNRLREADLNLDVAERVERLLLAQGVTVELTRRTDAQVVIPARAELILALDPELVVSVHHNGGALGPSAVPGTIVFHQADSPASRRLAGLLHEDLTTRLATLGLPWTMAQAPGAFAVRGADGTDYYGILRRTSGIPTVLTESLVLSSPAEAAALERDDVRQLEAEAITAGILRYLTTTEPGSGYRAGLTFGAGGVPAGEPYLCVDPPLG